MFDESTMSFWEVRLPLGRTEVISNNEVCQGLSDTVPAEQHDNRDMLVFGQPAAQINFPTT